MTLLPLRSEHSVDKAPQVTLRSTSHYFLEGLNEIGVEHLFCNLGTDHAPIIEELARWRKEKRSHATTVLCPHENVAVHMAAGYTWITGRGQAVLVHVDAGTANSAMALHNLARARIPVLLMAGRAPYTLHGELPGTRDNFVHFIQDPFDQAALVRPYVKWEYNLHSGVNTKEVLRRAHSLMHSDPQGPVYLTLPREVLAQSWDEAAVRSFPESSYGAVSARGTDAQTVAEIAARLLAAKYPILITRYGGRNTAFPAVLEELARFAGVRVYEASATHLGIAHDSPCYLGISAHEAIPKTDLGLLVDVDVPWIPRDTRENPDTCWVHIDVDVIKDKMPMWGFPSQVRVQGDSCAILGQVLAALKEMADAKFRDAAARRMQEIQRESEARAGGLAKQAAERGAPGRIGASYLCAELSHALSPEDIVFNEGIRNAPTIFNHVMRTRPGTMFGMPGAGLGFSGGTALGAKLARRDAVCLQVCGDGSFYQGAPEAVFAVAKQYDLPFLCVVVDNSGWAAVRESTLRMYPQGDALAEGEFQARLAPKMDFSKIAESADAYGVRIDQPDQVADAIRKCLAEVKQGRSALLHACVTPF